MKKERKWENCSSNNICDMKNEGDPVTLARMGEAQAPDFGEQRIRDLLADIQRTNNRWMAGGFIIALAVVIYLLVAFLSK